MIASAKKTQAKTIYRVLLKKGYKPNDMVEILEMVVEAILGKGLEKNGRRN